jgi:hypothetical protein
MVELHPVDAVEVTLVVDNFVDVLMAGAEDVRRFPLAYDFFDHQQLVAEHGFSALVTVESGGRRSSILYDGGMTPKGLGNNLEVMEVDPAGLRASSGSCPATAPAGRPPTASPRPCPERSRSPRSVRSCGSDCRAICGVQLRVRRPPVPRAGDRRRSRSPAERPAKRADPMTRPRCGRDRHR